METLNSGERKNKDKYLLDDRQITKVLLTALPVLASFLEAADKDILDKAQFSYCNYGETYNQMTNICNMIEHNHYLRIIRERIERTISRAPKNHEK